MIPSRAGWRSPVGSYTLAEDEVHVWRATFDWPVTPLDRILSPEERERARRFRFDLHRKYFLIGRGLLRTLLSRYLGIQPGSLLFDYTPFGKPTLASPAESLRFNVSHSGDLLLIAVTLNRAVGVDIEQIHRDRAVAEIVEHFFSPNERSTLASLPDHVRHDAFFNCWTRKEAYIKAKGAGLSLPLDQFEVTFLSGDPAELLATQPDAAEAGRWRLRELDVADGYKAAIAVEGSQWRLVCWHWPVER
jgi:4'-phosphopantetheinyl transferase